MFCKVFFRSCIIVFSAIMDKTRNFLHCSAKTLYALNVGDSYWTIQRQNLESIHCDDRTSALSLDRKKAPSDDRSKQARLSVYSLKSLHFIKEFYYGGTQFNHVPGLEVIRVIIGGRLDSSSHFHNFVLYKEIWLN